MPKLNILILFSLFLISAIFIYTKISVSQLKKSVIDAKVLSAKIMLTPTFTPTPTPTHTPSPTPSPIPTLSPTPTPTNTPTPIPIIIEENLEELFTKYSNEYSIDKETLKKIAKCESGFNPNASSKYYLGLFQFSESLWVQTRILMNHNSDPNLRLNAEESIRTASFLISQGRLSVWPVCSN